MPKIIGAYQSTQHSTKGITIHNRRNKVTALSWNKEHRTNMSLAYAQKLSYKEDVGTVGMSEIFDPLHVLDQKVEDLFSVLAENVKRIHVDCQIEQLAKMIQKSKHLEAFTGAGISTSSGIPDFQGPEGVWTLQCEGKCVPEASLPFDRATPSMTHMSLVELGKAGVLKFISQNVDSLHLRSGIPREKLAELHGNSFREICPSCGVEYLWDFEVETIGMKRTTRHCSHVDCGARLIDAVLDWEVSFSDRPKLKKAVLHKQPFTLKREMIRTKPIIIVLKLNFSDGCGCQSANIEFPVNFQAPADSVVHDKDAVTQKLRKAVIQHQCCGQFSLVERKTLLSPEKEIDIYAITIDYKNSCSAGLSEDNTLEGAARPCLTRW